MSPKPYRPDCSRRCRTQLILFLKQALYPSSLAQGPPLSKAHPPIGPPIFFENFAPSRALDKGEVIAFHPPPGVPANIAWPTANGKDLVFFLDFCVANCRVRFWNMSQNASCRSGYKRRSLLDHCRRTIRLWEVN